MRALMAAWRKNAPELAGLVNGALPSFVAAGRPREPLQGLPVFCYHLVEAESFDADLEFLRRNGYRTLSGTEAIEVIEGSRELPQRAVLLTFDDGAKNFYDVAFPLLKRYEARAVHFIAPGLHSDTADIEGDSRPMTWPEIREIHATGLVEFQSHTLESRFVPEWPKPVPLAGCQPALEESRRVAPLPFKEDLAASRAHIESQLPGAKVVQLAFPAYLGTPEAMRVAQSLGFRACYWGLAPKHALNQRGDSPFFITRIGDEFLRRLPGEGRITLRQLWQGRVRRIAAARAWRRQHAAASR